MILPRNKPDRTEMLLFQISIIYWDVMQRRTVLSQGLVLSRPCIFITARHNRTILCRPIQACWRGDRTRGNKMVLGHTHRVCRPFLTPTTMRRMPVTRFASIGMHQWYSSQSDLKHSPRRTECQPASQMIEGLLRHLAATGCCKTIPIHSIHRQQLNMSSVTIAAQFSKYTICSDSRSARWSMAGSAQDNIELVSKHQTCRAASMSTRCRRTGYYRVRR